MSRTPPYPYVRYMYKYSKLCNSHWNRICTYCFDWIHCTIVHTIICAHHMDCVVSDTMLNWIENNNTDNATNWHNKWFDNNYNNYCLLSIFTRRAFFFFFSIGRNSQPVAVILNYTVTLHWILFMYTNTTLRIQRYGHRYYYALALIAIYWEYHFCHIGIGTLYRYILLCALCATDQLK